MTIANTERDLIALGRAIASDPTCDGWTRYCATTGQRRPLTNIEMAACRSYSQWRREQEASDYE